MKQSILVLKQNKKQNFLYSCSESHAYQANFGNHLASPTVPLVKPRSLSQVLAVPSPHVQFINWPLMFQPSLFMDSLTRSLTHSLNEEPLLYVCYFDDLFSS